MLNTYKPSCAQMLVTLISTMNAIVQKTFTEKLTILLRYNTVARSFSSVANIRSN